MNDNNITDEQKDLQFVFWMQTIATTRNVPVKKRYLALAMDVLALSEGREAIETKKLV